jgi:hypothetical protein
MYTESVMSFLVHRVLRGLARAGVGCLLGGAMMVPLGPTTTSQAVNQINGTSMRALPSVAAPAPTGQTMLWVPTRVVPWPGHGTVVVPGHWERRLDGRDVYVPSLTVRNPQTGDSTVVPSGTRAPIEERSGP